MSIRDLLNKWWDSSPRTVYWTIGAIIGVIVELSLYLFDSNIHQYTTYTAYWVVPAFILVFMYVIWWMFIKHGGNK